VYKCHVQGGRAWRLALEGKSTGGDPMTPDPRIDWLRVTFWGALLPVSSTHLTLPTTPYV